MREVGISINQIVELTIESFREMYDVEISHLRTIEELIKHIKHIRNLSDNTFTPVHLVIKAHSKLYPLVGVLDEVIADLGLTVYNLDVEADTLILTVDDESAASLDLSESTDDMSELLEGMMYDADGEHL